MFAFNFQAFHRIKKKLSTKVKKKLKKVKIVKFLKKILLEYSYIEY